ncbi:MAG: PQQ-binding-like beta-propeller repeat protein [Actinomycetota bacterium]
MSDDGVRKALQRIPAPDELDAQRRAWPLVRAALETREPLATPRRNLRPLLVAAVLVAVLAAAISPPGRALVGSVKDAVTDEKVKAGPALTSLPAPGMLLVNAKTGPWLVRSDGSKRSLGPWWEGSWSPQAKYVVVTRAHELAAIDPEAKGAIRWSLARPGAVHAARWSPGEGFRIAYLNGRELRVVAGDGTADGSLRKVVGATPPAWRPVADHELAFAAVDGRIELVEADSGKTLWRTVPGEVPTQLVWSEDGERLLVLGESSLRVLDSDGRKLWSTRLPVGPSGVAFVRKSHRFVMVRFSAATGRSDLVLLQAETDPGEERFLYSAPGDFGTLAISPNGNWLLVGWVNADQWLFLRLNAARVQAVSNIVEQFGATPGGPLEKAFPKSVSWCCPASP